MNEDQIKELIASTLKVSKDKIQNDLAIGDIPEWDSLGHISIISALESSMGLSLDIEQIIEIEDIQDILDLFLIK